MLPKLLIDGDVLSRADLTWPAKAVYSLIRFRGRGGWHADSRQGLGDELGLTARQVGRALTELTAAALVREEVSTAKGRPSRYHVTAPASDQNVTHDDQNVTEQGTETSPRRDRTVTAALPERHRGATVRSLGPKKRPRKPPRDSGLQEVPEAPRREEGKKDKNPPNPPRGERGVVDALRELGVHGTTIDEIARLEGVTLDVVELARDELEREKAWNPTGVLIARLRDPDQRARLVASASEVAEQRRRAEAARAESVKIRRRVIAAIASEAADRFALLDAGKPVPDKRRADAAMWKALYELHQLGVPMDRDTLNRMLILDKEDGTAVWTTADRLEQEIRRLRDEQAS